MDDEVEQVSVNPADSVGSTASQPTRKKRRDVRFSDSPEGALRCVLCVCA